MSFRDPTMLLALLAIPLAALAWRLRGPPPRFAVRLPTAGDGGRAAAAGIGASASAATAAAGARHGSAAVCARAAHRADAGAGQRASVMLVTDASGSMAAEDVSPTRLSAVQSASRDFSRAHPSSCEWDCSPTQAPWRPCRCRHQPCRGARGLRCTCSRAAEDGHRRCAGCGAAAACAAGRAGGAAPAAILLLSDGMVSGWRQPDRGGAACARARRAHLTVALGTPQGTVQIQPGAPPLQVPPDPQTLGAIAQVSGAAPLMCRMQRARRGVRAARARARHASGHA